MNKLTAQPSLQQRHYGLDLLRIVSMLMIVMLHVIGRGGVNGAVSKGSIAYYINVALFYAALGGVNCYALLSGYFGIGKRNRFASISALWLQVFVYSLGITLCLRLFLGRGGGLLESAFPVLNKQYWYFTAYFILFLLSPVINAALEKLSVSQLGTILLISGVCFSISIYFEDVFILNGGYSAQWLIYLYLLGGMFRKTGTGTRKLKWAVIFAATVLLNVIVQQVSLRLRWEQRDDQISYTNPLLVLASVSAFLFCANLKIRPGSLWGKIIGAISPLCFGVYLIHTHPGVFNLLQGAFSFLGKHSPVVMTGGILAATLAIFLTCCAIEALRQLIFRWLRLRKLLESLGKYPEALMEKVFRVKEN